MENWTPSELPGPSFIQGSDIKEIPQLLSFVVIIISALIHGNQFSIIADLLLTYFSCECATALTAIVYLVEICNLVIFEVGEIFGANRVGTAFKLFFLRFCRNAREQLQSIFTDKLSFVADP